MGRIRGRLPGVLLWLDVRECTQVGFHVGAGMDQQQTQNIEQATEQLTDSARQSFQMLADRTVALQESNLRLTHNFFQNWIEQVQSQSQAVQEQGQRQREAFETLSQEATNAYSEFLDSALSFYQEALSTATQVAQGNVQQAAQATQQGMQAGLQAAIQAGQQAMEAADQAGQQGAQQAANLSAQKVREPAGLEYAGSDRTAAVRLIDELLAEDPSYDEETWPEIAEALDRDRLSDRKLFVD